MQSNIRIGLGFIAPLCVACILVPARAQTTSPDLQEGFPQMQAAARDAYAAQFDGGSASAGFDWYGWSWGVVNFYTIYDRSRPRADGRPSPWWVAKRTAGAVRPPINPTISWADSRSCPQLVDVIVAMTRLPPPPLRLRSLEPYAPPMGMPLTDGTVFSVWSGEAVQPENQPARVQASSSLGPIATWGEAATKALQGCWRDQPPRLP